MCAERVREYNSFETWDMFCRQTERAISFPSNQQILHHVRTRIILWQKGHTVKTATCKRVLPAPSLAAALGH